MGHSLIFTTSIILCLSSIIGMIGNLIVLFAFISNAVRNKAVQPLDRIIINMSLVNFLLCCYKTVPAFLFFIRANILDQLGCRILLYSYHTLRLISIWSVENLSFLHLIKIRRPNHRWSKFIYRHQGQYVNGTLAGCWIVSILLQIPYLQYEKTTHRDNATIIWLSTSTCLGSTESLAMKFTTYFSISLDLALVVLVIVLNCFIIDLLYKHSRKVEATTSVTSNGWNKHTAQATKVLLSLLCIYVVCWISNDLVWIAIMSGYIKSDFENSILNELFGILSSIYYSASSYVVVFGYRKVREYLTEACWCFRYTMSTKVQSTS
ncbi:olfactory receptor class A-like protein 1 [Anolis carolinensis]|uniref:olfactory receptor class A-like protein 1 n=1 Tax=Anolis carolinensis TaxID=28377 RepID=UPI0007DB7CF3|nr:PREDICTED: taste receptor type 2 member 104 [Anolis carolinensis]|eukprot:XP_016851780.1 PREDICTED: taste receptor type 2 member 104 [Anolis carolinensis]